MWPCFEETKRCDISLTWPFPLCPYNFCNFVNVNMCIKAVKLWAWAVYMEGQQEPKGVWPPRHGSLAVLCKALSEMREPATNWWKFRQVKTKITSRKFTWMKIFVINNTNDTVPPCNSLPFTYIYIGLYDGYFYSLQRKGRSVTIMMLQPSQGSLKTKTSSYDDYITSMLMILRLLSSKLSHYRGIHQSIN